MPFGDCLTRLTRLTRSRAECRASGPWPPPGRRQSLASLCGSSWPSPPSLGRPSSVSCIQTSARPSWAQDWAPAAALVPSAPCAAAVREAPPPRGGSRACAPWPRGATAAAPSTAALRGSSAARAASCPSGWVAGRGAGGSSHTGRRCCRRQPRSTCRAAGRSLGAASCRHWAIAPAAGSRAPRAPSSAPCTPPRPSGCWPPWRRSPPRRTTAPAPGPASNAAWCAAAGRAQPTPPPTASSHGFRPRGWKSAVRCWHVGASSWGSLERKCTLPRL
mmetsp:Transcript_127290/g.302351  ORF Transcript_127290/g.302351 Transcript_127290/m.302351 type:complete len:275 (-) Transcript_127290:10-834(-)